MANKDYSASSVKYLLWFVEMRETIKLLRQYPAEKVREIVIDQNVYQQKAPSRIINEFGCISRRIESVPDKLTDLMLDTDLSTAKMIALVAAMAADRMFFELMYEVYREKLRMGEEELKPSDLNIFFSRKAEQSDYVAGLTEATVKKLKQVYQKWMLEAGILQKAGKNEKKIVRPYIDPDLRNVLLSNNMESYLYALTGEA